MWQHFGKLFLCSKRLSFASFDRSSAKMSDQSLHWTDLITMDRHIIRTDRRAYFTKCHEYNFLISSLEMTLLQHDLIKSLFYTALIHTCEMIEQGQTSAASNKQPNEAITDAPWAQRCSQRFWACAEGTLHSSWASVPESSRTVWPENKQTTVYKKCFSRHVNNSLVVVSTQAAQIKRFVSSLIQRCPKMVIIATF